MKICTKCKEEKSITEFNKNKSTKDLLATQCKACHYQYTKAWKVRHRDKHNANNRDHYKRNAEHARAKHKEWKQSNTSLVNAHRTSYRASKLKAQPPWLTDEHLKQIADTYWLAKDLEAISGEQYHVDHIVPLQGKDVCGLHVPWNLQVLPADINLKKSNK